ncbi:hypothetical protein L1987_84302 [Smallanthus sonchifolius]|uniref:Uncharacterized protein n=1 Tax=Smallanthus sonchifolius TaxID=185202 RepID=A0ACB8YE91_9ASTR|nr:hypothetical protein L1987_84302 [Smallanthus sonchifolius]
MTTTTAPNTQLRVGVQSTTKLAKSTRTPSVLEQMVHTAYLDMGSKQHWMAGGGANEKEAPESSSKATSNMNDKLNELLDPYVQSLFKGQPSKSSVEEKKIDADIDGNSTKKNEFVAVVLGLPQFGKSTTISQLTRNTSQLRNKRYTFVEVWTGGNLLNEKGIMELSLGDSVILVIDSTKDFREGYENKKFLGLCFVAYSLGFRDLICCINKIDLLSCPAKEYRELMYHVNHHLNHVGFDPTRVQCVPMSASTGDNILETSKNYDWYNILEKKKKFGWYTGSTLMETLYQIRFPFKEINPLRMLVHDVDVNQFTIIGRVHSGKLATHDHVIICPGNWSTYVDEIKLNNEIVKDAYPSEIVSLKLRGLLDGVASRGALVSAPGFDQARVTEAIIAKC